MICIPLVGERTGRSLVAVLVLMAAAFVGCKTSSEPLGPTATLPVGTTTTNPYAVPAVIDEPYVNKVLAGLDQAVGDVTRIVVSMETVPPEALDRLRALYVGEHRQIQFDLFASAVDEGLTNYRQPPGNRKTAVSELLAVSPACLFAKVARDYSEVAIEAGEGFSTQWVVLVPADGNGKPYNPTGWVFVYDGLERDGSAPENPCAG
jgi:hypothetical protein